MQFLIVLFSTFLLTVQTLGLNSTRSLFKEAAQDKTKVEKFYNSLSHVTKNDKAQLIAYKGASITLLAKQAKTIKAKKLKFIEGVSLVEFALEKSPNNIEIRFIRLCIQENTPKLLKYKGNLNEDKHFILKQLKHTRSKHLKNHIKDYISHSKVFTDEEKTVILNS